jgi:hypothetical protein
MTGIPSTVPYGADQTLYLVMDLEGPKGQEFRNPVERPDFDTVIADLMAARFSNPVGIFAFNTLEHWTADISKNVAEEILCRCDIDGTPVPEYLEDFVANSLNGDRARTRLPG